MYNLQKLSKFRPPVQCTDNPIKSNRFYIFVDYLAFLTPYVFRDLCLFLIIESALKVCRSNSDTPCMLFHFSYTIKLTCFPTFL
jgi:hypothetical protein